MTTKDLVSNVRVSKRAPVLGEYVDALELTIRPANCLKELNLYFIGDLVGRTENGLLARPNFGKSSLREVVEALAIRGLKLGMSVRKLEGVWYID